VGYNRHLYNNALYNTWAAAVDAFAEQGRRFYVLEVAGATGTLLARLPLWGSAVLRERVNTFPEIEFTYPYDDEFASHLTTGFPNLIVLRDRDGELLERFAISKVIKERTPDNAKILTVCASGLLSILGKENVDSYDTAGTPTPVKEIVRDLLNDHQNNGVIRQVRYGSISSAIGNLDREFKWENQSILACLRDIQKTVGGYLAVDANWRFTWKSTLGSSKGQEIRASKNIKSLRVSTDYDAIVTQLIGKGYGATDTTRLLNTQTNAAAEATYGRITRPYSANTVRVQDTLDDITAAHLDKLDGPSIGYGVESIDLSEADGPLDYSDDAIELGGRVRLIDTDMDVNISTCIISTTRDLGNPMDVQLNVSDTNAGSDLYPDGAPTGTLGAGEGERTFLDDIADLIRKMLEQTTQDTGLIDAVDQAAANDEFTDVITTQNIDSSGAVLSDAVPEDTATAGAAGTGTKAAHEDHEHKGIWQAFP